MHSLFWKSLVGAAVTMILAAIACRVGAGLFAGSLLLATTVFVAGVFAAIEDNMLAAGADAGAHNPRRFLLYFLRVSRTLLLLLLAILALTLILRVYQ